MNREKIVSLIQDCFDEFGEDYITDIVRDVIASEEKKNKIEVDQTTIVKDIATIKEKLNELIDSHSDLDLTIKEYGKAIQFLNWFDFNKIYSYKLREEARNKKYEYLPATDIRFKSFSVSKLGEYISLNTTSYATVGDLCVNSRSYSDSYMDYNTIKIGDDIVISRNKEEPKVNYNETVAYVVTKPFEFEPNVILRVYKYLLKIVEKDKEIKNYKNF